VTLDRLVLVTVESLNAGDGEGHSLLYVTIAITSSISVIPSNKSPFLRLRARLGKGLIKCFFLLRRLYNKAFVKGLLLVKGELSVICLLIGDKLAILYCIKRWQSK